MVEHDTVTVYNFEVRGFLPDSRTHSPFKAPRELIRHKFNGHVLEGTGEDVPRSELDGEGRYRRIASGWGELP